MHLWSNHIEKVIEREIEDYKKLEKPARSRAERKAIKNVFGIDKYKEDYSDSDSE